MVAAQHKSFEAEQSLCSTLREYVNNYGRDQDQARTLMKECWQSMQNRGTKNMNLAKDLEDFPQPGECAGAKKKRQSCGTRWRVTNNKPRSPESQPKMERIRRLIADWIPSRR